MRKLLNLIKPAVTTSTKALVALRLIAKKQNASTYGHALKAIPLSNSTVMRRTEPVSQDSKE
jgi:hypothetical protein